MIKPPKILVIKSDTSELKKVEIFLRDILKFYGLPKSNFYRIYLCVSEAVINSIEHGNKSDENKKVNIEVQCEGKELNITIKDEGKGIDIEKITDPTEKSNLKKESGRGIHIIRSYCDKYEFEKNKSFIRFKMDCQ